MTYRNAMLAVMHEAGEMEINDLEPALVIERDLTTITEGIVAHGCNCTGGFGSGVAGAIKAKWPVVYHAFKALPPCPELLGEIQIIRVNEGLFVVNMFTQIEYGPKRATPYADEEAIFEALMKVEEFAVKIHKNLYISKVGCDRGGLVWEHHVEPGVAVIAQGLKEAGLSLTVCSYNG